MRGVYYTMLPTTYVVLYYNSVISKFVGGKRVNFSLKGGYTTRCYGAALSYNSEKGMYHDS